MLKKFKVEVVITKEIEVEFPSEFFASEEIEETILTSPERKSHGNN